MPKIFILSTVTRLQRNQIGSHGSKKNSKIKKSRYRFPICRIQKILIVNNGCTIFIGHSLGCIAIIRFLLEKNIKINGAIFVSGFIDENPMSENTEGLQSFFSDPLDIERLKYLIPNRVAITAADDDIVPSVATKKMAEKINAKLMELNSGKHFIDRDGYTQFPILLKETESMIHKF